MTISPDTIFKTSGARKLGDSYLQSSPPLVSCVQYTYEVLLPTNQEWRVQLYLSFQGSRKSPTAAILLYHLRAGSACVPNISACGFLIYSRILCISSKDNGKRGNHLNEGSQERETDTPVEFSGFITSPQEALPHRRKTVLGECTQYAGSESTPTLYASSPSFSLSHFLFTCALTHPLPSSVSSLSFCTF